MRAILSAFVGSLLALLVGGVVVWQSGLTLPTGADANVSVLRVDGSGIIEFPADTATFSLKIEATGPTRQDAKSALLSDLSPIARELLEFSEGGFRVGSPQVSLEPIYEIKVLPDGDVITVPDQIKAYRAVGRVEVEVRELVFLSAGLSRLAQLDISELSDITYRLVDDLTARQLAYDQAVDVAHLKAKTYTERLGARIKRIIRIDEAVVTQQLGPIGDTSVQVIDGKTARERGLIDTAEILQSSTSSQGQQLDGELAQRAKDQGFEAMRKLLESGELIPTEPPLLRIGDTVLVEFEIETP